MKRIIAILLAIATALSSFFALTGCSSGRNVLSKGEWLLMMAEEFGMYSYKAEQPFTETVDEDNKYFPYVQSAFEWGIIDDKSIDIDSLATKGFVADTLVKCVGMKDTEGMSEEEILEYAVDNDYVSFKYRGRTDSIRNVTKEEAEKSVNSAFKIWSNKKFEYKEDLQLGDKVTDLTTNNSITSSNLFVNKDNNTVKVPASAIEGLQPGETFVVPKNNADASITAYKAEKIEYKDGYAIIKTGEPEMENTIQDLKASGSVAPDLTLGTIIDGAGNVCSSQPNASIQSNIYQSNELDYLGARNVNEPYVDNLASGKVALNFNMDGLKITGSVSGTEVSFSVEGDIVTNEEKGMKLTVEKSYAIKDVSLDYDYDISWFKLKSAYAKVNYTTVDTTGVAFKYEKEGVFAPKHTNGNGKFLSNFTRAILKDSKAKGAKTIKICSIPIVSGGAVSFNLDVKIKFSFTGSVELVVTTNNVKGIEYKNGNIRYIKDEHKDTDISVKAKAELTMYAGFSFRALSINIIGFGVEGGIGCIASLTVHVADTNNHLLEEMSFEEVNTTLFEDTLAGIDGISYEHDAHGTLTLKKEICIDVTTYGILKFVLDDDSVIGSLFEGSEIVIFDENNAAIKPLCGHWEDGTKVSECTREYKDFEEEKKDDQNEDSDENNDAIIERTDSIDVEVYFISLMEGESEKIKIIELPKGYTEDDIVYESANSKIASVDSNGNIKAHSSGSVDIKVSTKDGKYSAHCSVFVAGSGVTFSGIIGFEV